MPESRQGAGHSNRVRCQRAILQSRCSFTPRPMKQTRLMSTRSRGRCLQPRARMQHIRYCYLAVKMDSRMHSDVLHIYRPHRLPYVLLLRGHQAAATTATSHGHRQPQPHAVTAQRQAQAQAQPRPRPQAATATGSHKHRRRRPHICPTAGSGQIVAI
jgi:hypothetical protein